MNQMLKSIEPKSDQLNADDLIGGRSITIKIIRVAFLGGDQPFAFHYEGDNGKPYKPCKSMRRVIVNAWGDDANLYAGRLLRLYRDEKVKFGSDPVGGIRISHMSGIDSAVTMALTVSRAIRKPYTVKPLSQAAQGGMAAGRSQRDPDMYDMINDEMVARAQAASSNSNADAPGANLPAEARDLGTQRLLDDARAKIKEGSLKFKNWVARLNRSQFDKIAPYLEELRAEANAVLE